jgi:hypothetical protein
MPERGTVEAVRQLLEFGGVRCATSTEGASMDEGSSGLLPVASI